MILIYAVFERLVWLATFIVTRLFVSFKVIGRENLAGLNRPAMIISNHRTFFDPLIIGTLFPFFSRYLPIAFMVDDRYYFNPILRLFFKLTQTFPSYYGQGLAVSLKSPRQVLKSGGVFLIFPTGQRHSGGPRPKPKRGAAVLAIEMPRLDILPVYLRVSKNSRQKIMAAIGRPFKLADITSSRDLAAVADLLAERIYELM